MAGSHAIGTYPCPVCRASAPAVTDAPERLRCESCGAESSFRTAPVVLVTGLPGAGKTTLYPALTRSLPGVAVFDTDLLGADQSTPWEIWASSWLTVAHGLAQTGLSTVLCGYGLRRSTVEALPRRALLGSLHVVHLRVAEAILKERLRTRADYDEARIRRKLSYGVSLAAEADAVIDITGQTPAAAASLVAAWVNGAVSNR